MACEYFTSFAIILISLAISVITFFKYRYTYWKRRGVEVYGTPVIPFGSVKDFLAQKEPIAAFLQKLYNNAKSKGLKYTGYYFIGSPFFVPIDRDIIKRIFLTDSDVFVNRGLYTNEKDDPISANVFTSDGEKWKYMRQKISQTFTSGQLKFMFGKLAETGVKLEALMERHPSGQPLNARDTTSKFTNDFIASSGFGIECNSLEGNESEFIQYGAKIFKPSPIFFVKNMLFLSLPHNLLRRAGITVFSSEIRHFFRKIVEEAVSYRENNDVYRKDFLHLLIQFKNRGKLVNDGKVNGEKEGSGTITFEQLTAAVFVFYAAGYETSSTTSAFALYYLSINQDIQDNVREEINDVLDRYDGKLSYEAVLEMTYLHQVVEETLRLSPPGPFVERRCNRDYKIPDTDVVLEKNTVVQLPIWALHMDPEYFENPEEFNPDRFSAENKKNILQCTYVPFGEGPRICIGLRLGYLQTKVALISMLKNYRVTLNPKTKTPFVMEPDSLVLSPVGGIWIDIEKIN